MAWNKVRKQYELITKELNGCSYKQQGNINSGVLSLYFKNLESGH